MNGLKIIIRWTMACILVCVLFGCATTQEERDLEVNPDEIKLRLDLAESYLSSDQPRVALKELLLLEPIAQRNARYQYISGLTYVRLKEWTKAKEHLEKATRLSPSYGEAFVNLGTVYIALKDPAKAQASFKTALSILTYLTPELPAFNLALLAFSQQKYAEAETYATLAVERNWRFTAAYLLLADILAKQGKNKDAIEWLKRGVESDVDNLQVILRLAESLLRTGEVNQAKNWFRRIIEINPKGEEARLARDYLDIL